jgi:hypothetical protein
MSLDGRMMIHHASRTQLNVRPDVGKRSHHHIGRQFRLFIHYRHGMNLCHFSSLLCENYKRVSSGRSGFSPWPTVPA